MVLMEMLRRKNLGVRSLFLAIILGFWGISGVRAEEEEITTRVPSRAPAGIMFNMDRKPGQAQRIINGAVATPHAYPFQVALHVTRKGGLFLCGGTLLNTEWVLTAAHCVDDADHILVILGAHTIDKADSIMKLFNSTKFVKHQGYDPNSLRNDLGLVKLPSSAPLNSYIQLVHLSLDRQSFEGQTARCLGWGTTILGTTSNVLRYVDLEIISNDKCKQYSEFKPYVTEKNLCTAGEGFIGSCQGDSGGPLMIGNEQVGVVSFGSSKCDTGRPSAFSRVPEFIGWIQQETGIRMAARSGTEACKMGGRFIEAFMLGVAFLRYI